MPPTSQEPITALLIAAVLALAPTDAEAGGDELWGTRGDQTMVEREHQIALTFERGYATMVVRRTVHNGFERHDEAVYELLIPDRGVATGLRTLGERRGKPHWYAADLLEAGLAEARYRELTGFDPHVPEVKDPALLAWHRQGELVLQVFPVAPKSDKTVEYTIDMPASWGDGRWVLELEASGLDGQPAELVVQPRSADDRLYLDDQPIEAGHRLLLDDWHTLSLIPREPAPVELELASVDTGSDRALVHWRVMVAPELSRVPERARVVVALDLSRSLTEEVLEAQRQAALAYLEHFMAPELAAEVAVIGFDHAIRPLTQGFVSAAEASGALRGASLERRNGSGVDLALAEAGRLLAGSPKKSPRRVLLLTDFATASSRSIANFEALARETKAIVHLAELGVYERPALFRDDLHPWASVAAGTEGVVWQAYAPADGGPSEGLVEVFEEWARPLRVDMPLVDLGGPGPEDWGPSLKEGESVGQQYLADAGVERLTLSGRLWNREIEHQARRSRSLSKRWAALVFGSHAMHELEPEEMLRLALLGGAVSPVSSYLAVEPGVRPSVEGLLGAGNIGLIGKGGGGAVLRESGRSSGVAFSGRLDRQAWLDEQLNAAWRYCGAARQSAQPRSGAKPATVELEATYDEIVDFELSGVVDPALSTCMQSRTWALLLPTEDFVEDRSRWIVELQGS
ncbi:MAG: VWA domain-containing protein [Enhygromyxa sp.]